MADDKVTVEYDGVIEVSTLKAIGLAPKVGDEVEVWIPKRCLGTVEYDKEGDSDEIWLRRQLRSLQVSASFARQENLV